MLEIPENVYLKEPGFVQYDEETVIDLVRDGLSDSCFKYSIQGVLIDSRVRELLQFAENWEVSFSQAVDLRVKQVEGSISAFPEGDNPDLENYRDFLCDLRQF